jgi:hypothetical protein
MRVDFGWGGYYTCRECSDAIDGVIERDGAILAVPKGDAAR